MRKPRTRAANNPRYEKLAPLVRMGGRPRTHPLRRILDASFYVVRTGCLWPYLPSDFPRWQTVFYHFRRFRLKGTWHLLYSALHRANRRACSTGADATLVDIFEAESASYFLDPSHSPCVGVEVEGRMVTIAHSSRRTASACELGINTLPEARRRGYARLATMLWTAMAQQQGLVPIYSAFAWNQASLQLAQVVGYEPRVDGVYGPMDGDWEPGQP